MKKFLGYIVFLLMTIFILPAFADQKSSFANILKNATYIIDNAYWRNNDLLVFVETNDLWSGADTYSLAETICNSLKDQGFAPISNYSVTILEKIAQSKLLKLGC